MRTLWSPVAAAFLLALAGVGCASHKQDAYASPDAATQALVAAVRSNDAKALERVFGPEADELLDSGDDVADHARMEKFLRAYDERHRLDTEDPDRVTLVIGNQDWPLPIPIMKEEKTGLWYFDTDAGKDEIINRRIGQNELDVIQVCQAVVDAQKEYAAIDPEKSGIPHYASKFISDPGKKNGLYWPTAPGEAESPLGPLVGDAVEEGYSTEKSSEGPRPYHGYYYRILDSQGPDAPGGEVDYRFDGKLVGGFGVVAYPADYGNSGIMTFIVNHEGVVYQKDLGKKTKSIAERMRAFNPSPDWQKAEPVPDAAKP